MPTSALIVSIGILITFDALADPSPDFHRDCVRFCSFGFSCSQMFMDTGTCMRKGVSDHAQLLEDLVPFPLQYNLQWPYCLFHSFAWQPVVSFCFSPVSDVKCN